MRYRTNYNRYKKAGAKRYTGKRAYAKKRKSNIKSVTRTYTNGTKVVTYYRKAK